MHLAGGDALGEMDGEREEEREYKDEHVAVRIDYHR